MLRIIRIADIAKFIAEMIFLIVYADCSGWVGVRGEPPIAIETPPAIEAPASAAEASIRPQIELDPQVDDRHEQADAHIGRVEDSERSGIARTHEPCGGREPCAG